MNTTSGLRLFTSTPVDGTLSSTRSNWARWLTVMFAIWSLSLLVAVGTRQT